MFFLGRGIKSHIHHNIFFQTFPMSNLKNTLPVHPGNAIAWMLTGPPVYPADLLSRRFRGEECYKAYFWVILLVDLLQVVKRTNTPPLN